ncbi:hypothetical protein PTTG_30269, partial [Puccinia triticina 1-1 BBBD Race 1]
MSLKIPNHPVSFSSHFEPLAPSTTESARANQYGFVKTSSYFSGGGPAENKHEKFKVNLVTNTSLNNVLEPENIYSMDESVTRVCLTGDDQPDFTNKTNVNGLGMVIKRQEVAPEPNENGVRLEVIVAHSDWDSEARVLRKFNVKYIVPGSKNLIKTHSLYIVGREVSIIGRLVDFDMEESMAVVQASYVSITNGHQLGKLYPAGQASPSGNSSPNQN